MKHRGGSKKEMPNVPKMNFIDALTEIWSQVNFVAYHMAYVRVYSQSAALQTHASLLRDQEQALRNDIQADITICRSHLTAFFWHLDHIFEALRTAISKGQNEYPNEKYFWAYEKQLDEAERLAIRQEIKDYRNMTHQNPAIIGVQWDEHRKFVKHFLPTIAGHEPREDLEMNERLQQYFEFAANAWLAFAPGDFKTKFPRDFEFPVTIPYLYTGQLPEELKRFPQFKVRVEEMSLQS